MSLDWNSALFMEHLVEGWSQLLLMVKPLWCSCSLDPNILASPLIPISAKLITEKLCSRVWSDLRDYRVRNLVNFLTVFKMSSHLYENACIPFSHKVWFPCLTHVRNFSFFFTFQFSKPLYTLLLFGNDCQTYLDLSILCPSSILFLHRN